MNTLLMKIQGNKYVNHSMFRPYLYIYDDFMLYKKRSKFVRVEEITLLYNHIVQVYLHKGIFFSTLEIMNSGTDNLIMKGVWNGPAKKAKVLIDRKIHQAHHRKHEPPKLVHSEVDNIEKTLNRLTELLNRGHITQKEFDKQKQDLVKRL